MGSFRGCLMLMGFVGLLVVTSCVVGITGMRKVANPTQFSFTVTEAPDKTRRMIGDYLELAENESTEDRGLTRPSVVRVDDYTDGSVHLTLDSGTARLMEIVATVTPVNDEETRVEVFSHAEGLAGAVRPRIAPSALHREIRQDLGAAIQAIGDQRVVPGGFQIARVIEGARGERRFARMHR